MLLDVFSPLPGLLQLLLPHLLFSLILPLYVLLEQELLMVSLLLELLDRLVDHTLLDGLLLLELASLLLLPLPHPLIPLSSVLLDALVLLQLLESLLLPDRLEHIIGLPGLGLGLQQLVPPSLLLFLRIYLGLMGLPLHDLPFQHLLPHALDVLVPELLLLLLEHLLLLLLLLLESIKPLLLLDLLLPDLF